KLPIVIFSLPFFPKCGCVSKSLPPMALLLLPFRNVAGGSLFPELPERIGTNGHGFDRGRRTDFAQSAGDAAGGEWISCGSRQLGGGGVAHCQAGTCAQRRAGGSGSSWNGRRGIYSK